MQACHECLKLLVEWAPGSVYGEVAVNGMLGAIPARRSRLDHAWCQDKAEECTTAGH